jgi:hypothetical protein
VASRTNPFNVGDNTGFGHLALWENWTGTYSRPGPSLWGIGESRRYELRIADPTEASSAIAAGAERRVLGVSRLN